MDVRSLMRRAADFNAGREALVHGASRLTFAQAWERGLRLANAMLALGLRPGDRVGVLEDNCLSAGDAFLGLGAANLVRVPLYPRNSREGHAHMLGHTGCRALLVTDNHAASVAGMEDELPALEHVVVRDAGYEDWLAAHPATDPDPPVSPDDWYIIRHTAGTTGLSKGVAYTHKAWLDTGRDWFYTWPAVETGDRCLHIGPISHGSGYLFMPVWLGGGANHMVDHFDAGACLELMERERIGYVFAVPTILAALARHPGARGRDWSALKVINVGGSPISDDTALLAHEIFGDVLYQIYGQTEALPATMMGPREWFSSVAGSNPLRSAGRPLPFADLEILDDDANPVATGELGEIAVRKDGQMTEFWENPQATAERVVRGFVLTGDIGRVDANGYLYVLDRKDDMIISGGFNIWPAELENVIMSHPAILEAAVFGVPHPRWGETPMAVCQTDGVTAVAEDEIVALCQARLGSYKKPSRVILQQEPLPHTPVGKLARKLLREPYWEGVERRVAGSGLASVGGRGPALGRSAGAGTEHDDALAADRFRECRGNDIRRSQFLLFEALAQLAGNEDLRARREQRQRSEALAQAMRALEPNRRLLAGERRLELARPFAARPWEETAKEQAFERKARENGGNDEGARARQYLERDSLRACRGEQLAARVRNAGHPGVADDRDQSLARARQDRFGAARSVGFAVAHERLAADLVGGEQLARDPRVFGCDQVAGAQHVERAQRDVAQISDRGRHEHQRHRREPSRR